MSSSSSSSSVSTLPETYMAWRVVQQQPDDGSKFVGSEQPLRLADLLAAATAAKKKATDTLTTIRVTHSSLNYKDALCAAGVKGITRQYPHTPGIDAAGIVVQVSTDEENNNNQQQQQYLTVGQPVLVTGFDLGMNTPGGFGEYIRVPSSWIVPLSATHWTTTATDPCRTAMIYGTAGLTAALCVNALLSSSSLSRSATTTAATATAVVTRNVHTDDGPVVVTGASGAVGSVVTELLAQLGFAVTCISNKDPARLLELGAAQVVPRETLAATKKPLLQTDFAHAIDTVGGTPLVELLKKMRPGGTVVSCGNAAGVTMDGLTVLPFILRGVQLVGVDSVEIPLSHKLEMWKRLSSDWACPKTEQAARDIGRHELDTHLKAFLNGTSYGKIVLNHSLTPSSSKI